MSEAVAVPQPKPWGGAHQRLDFPALDPAFDGRHVTLTAGTDAAVAEWN